MSRRLIVLNVLLLAIAVSAAGYTARELMMPGSKPAPARPAGKPDATAKTDGAGKAGAASKGQATAKPDAPKPDATPAPPAPAATGSTATGSAARPVPASYAMVASRNLFSPTRTEQPVVATPARTAPPQPKPNLYGVIVREGTPIAYLEDPATKRVAGYRLGDSIAGGTVNAIHADHVVLNRPDGPVDVRLRDPGKPRPAPQPTTAPAAGIPPATTAQPGTPTPPTSVIPPAAVVPQPGIQPGQIPGQPTAPARRPLPPNVLRRTAPGAPNDGSQP